MAVEERQRHELHARLDQVLGPEEASTLMSYLPPVGWADVATKRDLDNFANQLRIEFRDAIHDEVGALRRDFNARIDGVHGELDARLDKLDDNLNGRIDKLDDRIDKLDARIDKLDEQLAANLRVLLFSMLGAIFTTASLAFGAAHL